MDDCCSSSARHGAVHGIDDLGGAGEGFEAPVETEVIAPPHGGGVHERGEGGWIGNASEDGVESIECTRKDGKLGGGVWGRVSWWRSRVGPDGDGGGPREAATGPDGWGGHC